MKKNKDYSLELIVIVGSISNLTSNILRYFNHKSIFNLLLMVLTLIATLCAIGLVNNKIKNSN